MQGSSNLAEILEATPRHRVEFDMSKVDIGKLTLMELLDASEASGVPFEDFRTALVDTNKQAALFYSLAWVIMRRQDKSLTYEAVCEYDLIVTGDIDEAEVERTQHRAKAVMSVAAITGTSPQEAADMEIAQVAAAVDIVQSRNRAARRRR